VELDDSVKDKIDNDKCGRDQFLQTIHTLGYYLLGKYLNLLVRLDISRKKQVLVDDGWELSTNIYFEVTEIYYYWKGWVATWQEEGSLIALSMSDKLP